MEHEEFQSCVVATAVQTPAPPLLSCTLSLLCCCLGSFANNGGEGEGLRGLGHPVEIQWRAGFKKKKLYSYQVFSFSCLLSFLLWGSVSIEVRRWIQSPQSSWPHPGWLEPGQPHQGGWKSWQCFLANKHCWHSQKNADLEKEREFPQAWRTLRSRLTLCTCQRRSE